MVISSRPVAATRRNQGQRRGMALAVVLMLTAALAVTAFGAAALVNNLTRTTALRTEQVEALNMADAGLDLAITWLQMQPSPPDDTRLHPLTNFFGTNGTISNPFGQSGTTLQIAIYSDSNNPGPTQKHYLVESKATMPSGKTKIVRAYLQQVSFGKYAYFADIDSSGFWDWHNHFEGPFHSNCSDGVNSTFLWTQNTQGEPPIFEYTGADAFSSSRDVAWWKDRTGTLGVTTTAPSSTSDFNAIAAGGQTSMTYGWMTDINGNLLRDSSNNYIPKSPPIPLPQTDYLQAYVALGLTPPASATSLPSSRPTTNGVKVTSGGGLYIHGQSQITLSVDANNNQVFTVVTTLNGNSQTQTVTVDAVNSNTSVRTKITNGSTTISDTTASVSGVPNGMVFADDTITALSGTVANNRVDANNNIIYRNQWTIATDTGAGKDMTLSGNLVYQTSRQISSYDSAGNPVFVPQAQDTNFNTKAGTLGLLTRNAILANGAGPQVEEDCMIFCTGSYKAANPSSPSASSNGRMEQIGGVIVKTSGIFAYANSDGSLKSGYQEQYHYDKRMADHPPPYFPTTGNHYRVTSWQTVQTTIQ